MKFAIINLKNSSHTICRTTGQQIVIKPKSHVILNTDDDRETLYWQNLDVGVAQRCGIRVVCDPDSSFESDDTVYNDRKMVYTDVSIVDGSVSPIAKSIVDNNFSTKSAETNHLDSPYNEQQLSQMDKEDLILICDNFNIKYRKNSSVKTLVKLILESDKI